MKDLTEWDKFWIALGMIAFLIVAAPALLRLWLIEWRGSKIKRD